MRQHGLRFNHNLHALRVVEHLEQRYASFPGLNLTFEVREGIVKHSMDFSAAEYPALSGYLPGFKPPLEAQLIDLADEAAYNTADLDDGYEAKLISFDDLSEAAPACAGIRESVETQFPGAPERARFHEFLRRLIDLLASGLIEGTRATALSSGVATWDEVRKLPYRIAEFTPEAAETSRMLKKFLLARVYNSPQLADERQRSAELVNGLFTLLVNEPHRIAAPYLLEGVPVAQCACDYVASMSDRQIQRFATLS
jgi:dGTPase